MTQSFFLGSYTPGADDPGITRWSVDADGALCQLGVLPRVENPSYLALSGDEKTLYAVLETDGPEGGSVAAFSLTDGSARQIGAPVATGGAYPCHLSLSPGGGKLYAANYGGGSLAVFSLEADGSIGRREQLIRHEGHGVNPARQEGPHVHQALPTPDGLLVMDLGLDAGFFYEILPDGSLGDVRQRLAFPAGAGPRHAVLHPGGNTLFAIGEMGNCLYMFHKRDGEWKQGAALSTLPPDFTGESTTAAVRLHAGGRYLAVSNRGHDSIALFVVNGEGECQLRHIVPCGAQQPRDCNWIGDLLVCACQSGGTLTVLRLDMEAGRLIETGERRTVEQPTCILRARGFAH